MGSLLKYIMMLGCLVSLSACVTPGIDYTAEIAPGNPQAAQLRTVAVERFRGPLSNWYADEFEDMLAEASFNNRRWFRVGLFSRQSNVQGVYAGEIEINRPYSNETFSTYSDCIERDEETKKCLKKKEIETVCIDYSIDVAVTPQLIDVAAGQIVHAQTYTASDSERECFETGLVVYKIRRGPDDPGRGKFRFVYDEYNDPGYRLSGDHIIDRITASALRSTIWQARRDIAPYNREVRATILTKAENLNVEADPRFKQAVDGIKANNIVFSCQVFADLAAEYARAPAVLHNLGACAEASGDSALAQVYYSDAASVAQSLGAAPAKRVLNALERISGTRSNEIILDTLLSRN